MAFDESADLIGSCEATLDTLGILIGDMSEEVQDRGGAWTIAQILNQREYIESEFQTGSVATMTKDQLIFARNKFRWAHFDWLNVSAGRFDFLLETLKNLT